MDSDDASAVAQADDEFIKKMRALCEAAGDTGSAAGVSEEHAAAGKQRCVSVAIAKQAQRWQQQRRCRRPTHQRNQEIVAK